MPGFQDAVESTPNKSRRWLLFAVGGIMMLGLVFAIQIIANAPEVGPKDEFSDGLPPAAVFVKTITQTTTQEFATVTGSLKSAARAEVAAREAGAVLEVLVDEGDEIQKDAILARLDARRTLALLAEAQASVTAAASLVVQRTAEQARAEDDLEMKRSLLARKAVSKSDVLDAEQALAVAHAQRNAASDGVEEMQSRTDFLKVQLEDLVIRAPFAGVVVARQVELGEWVAAGAPVASVVAVNPLEAWLRVPVRYRNSLSSAPDNLRVRQSATGAILTPSKVTLVPDVEPLSQLFTVVAVLDNTAGNLTPGESITGIVPVGNEEPHWQFPIDALVRSALGDFVYVNAEDDTAKRVAIKVAFERDGKAYVAASSGVLAAGDRVVVEGNDRLQPTQVMIIREQP